MKKLLFLGLLLLSIASFGQIKINPVQIGWHDPKQATDLMIRVMPFETTATTCQLYYEIKSESGEKLADGNITLTQEEFEAWGRDNVYIEDLALTKLGLCRKEIE